MSYTYTSLPSIWLEILVALACIAVWAYSVFSTRHQRPLIRIATSILRALILAVAFLVIHEFTLITRKTVTEPLQTAVLVDQSGSMRMTQSAVAKNLLAGSEAASRLDQAVQLVESLHSAENQTLQFSFDESLHPGPPQPGASSGTHFMNSISELLSKQGDLSQIVLISDGHDFSPLTTMTTEEVKTWLETVGSPPIHTILIGDQEDDPDFLIHSVEAPSFSYVRSPLKIDVTILGRKLEGNAPQVQLLEDEKIIQFQTAALDEHGFGRVSFEIYPDQVGEHLYNIHIPPHPDETNLNNNSQNLLIKTGRDKINVLHISGSVTPDLQGLRSIFEQDPFIEFTAFYILRTQEHMQIGVDGRMIPPEEMALVQFPVEEIFDRQLYSFDVVVFQDFDAGNYFRNSYQARKLMRKIATFVQEQNGGLVVIGGPRTAKGPPLALTAVGDILPVELFPYRTRYREASTNRFRTNINWDHPILEGFSGSFPKLFGSMELKGLHPEADLLIADSEQTPILATRHVGRGRTVFLNSSSSWLWRREALAKGETADAYHTFWRQVLKWVSGDPNLNPSQVTPNTSQERPLDLQAEIELRNANYHPVELAQGEAHIVPVDKSLQQEPITIPFTTSKEGRALIQSEVPSPGFYRLEIDTGPTKGAQQDDNQFILKRNIFLGGSVLEHQENAPVPETLQLLSDLSGGTYSQSEEVFQPSILEKHRKVKTSTTETQRLRLRDSIYLLPILLLLVAAEWYIRRQNHLA